MAKPATRNKAKAKRIGRPAIEFSIEAYQDQLVAPLIMPKPTWNSVDVAKFTGLSQSTISRTWQNTYPVEKSKLANFRSLDLLALNVTVDGTFLLFEFAPTLEKAPTINDHFMRSTKRRAFQVILASDLLTEKITDSPDYQRLTDFVRMQNSEDFLILASQPLPTALAELKIQSLVIDLPQEWHGLLHDLVTNSNMTKQETLNQIQISLMPWARNPKINFFWQKFENLNEVRISRRSKPLALNQVLSDQAFQLILGELRLGRITTGDRITESYLAKHLHTSRNQARDVIKTLSSAGLLEFENNKGAVIPTPSVSDVIDIYEARRALGSAVFRRAANMPASAFAESKAVLDRMIELGRLGNAMETGLHDILFQETVAANTGMRNFYEMFHDLALQLHLWLELLGLNYIYSIPDMCKDNENIFSYVVNGEADKAVAAWNKKMIDAQAHMTKQIEIWRRQH